MKAIKLFLVAAFAGTLLLSCQREKEIAPTPTFSGEYTLTVKAEKSIDTKALTLSADGKTLAATWEDGEQVGVCRIDPTTNNLGEVLGVLYPTTFGTATTVLQGTILMDGISEGDKLYLQCPFKYIEDETTGKRWLDCRYTGQDGDLNTVSKEFAYASCGVDITSLDGRSLVVSQAKFYNRQAIVNFSLKSDGSPLQAYKLRIFAPSLADHFWHDDYYVDRGALDVVYPPASRSEFTVALRNQETTVPEPYTLYAVTYNNVYTATTAPLLFADGSYNRGSGDLKAMSYTGYDTDSPWSIIGDLVEYNMYWNGDINMWTDGNGRHVAASVKLKMNDELKFRKDGAWAENLGCPRNGEQTTNSQSAVVGVISSPDAFGMEPDGLNILVPMDGVYDIYLDENTYTAIIVPASDAGKESVADIPGGGQQPTTSSWSLIGTINGTSWDTDFDLTDKGNDIWMIEGVTLTSTDQFKIRKDHDWEYSLGGPECNYQIPGDPDPIDVFKPTLGVAFSGGINIQVNIAVAVAGTYDITLNAADGTILISAAAPPDPNDVFTVVGESMMDSASIDMVFTSQWNCDESANDMIDSDGDGILEWYACIYAESYPLTAYFKIVRNHSWSAGDWPAANYEFSILGSGFFHVTFDPVSKAVNAWMEYDFPYTVAGTANVFGSNWDPTDSANKMLNMFDGTWLLVKENVSPCQIEFKVVKNHSWSDQCWPDQNYVYTIVGPGKVNLNIRFNPTDGSITVTEEALTPIVIDGKFDDWADLDASKISVATCASGASRAALKKIMVGADASYIYVYLEYDKSQILWGSSENAPIYLFLNSDGNSATGGYQEFSDACSDYLLDANMTNGTDIISYDPAVFKWTGDANAGGWTWETQLVDYGSGLGAGAGVEGKYELRIDRSKFPVTIANDFSIGVAMLQGWDPAGLLPNASSGTAPSLAVHTLL